MNRPTLEYIEGSPKGRTREAHIKKYFGGFYAEVMGGYDSNLRWPEKLWLAVHGMKEKPRCPVCGKECKFINFTRGYSPTCSYKCSYASGEHAARISESNKATYSSGEPVAKIKQTKLKNHGSENYNNIGQIRKTQTEKYGGFLWQSDRIRSKVLSTNLKRYGVEYPFQSTEVTDRSKATCMSKYGVEKPAQIGLMNRNPEVIGFKGNEWRCTCPHPGVCDRCEEKYYITTSERHQGRKKDGTELCTRLCPVGDVRSTLEVNIGLFLDSLGVHHIDNKRDILNGKELDIYIPEKKIAIELNGVYWHSDKFKKPKYHSDKFLECANNGVQLLQIWEDIYIKKPEVVKSVIKAKLGVFDHRVYARRCTVRRVDPKISRVFMNKNHIQGACGASYHYGLYYNGILVSVMTFGKRRPGMGGKKQINGQYELLRFCNLMGWQVVCGASRLLRHFIKDIHPKSIISYSSNDISDGNMYAQLGFKKADSISAGYWYVDGQMNRHHRYEFNKYQIIQKGLAPDPDPSKWTERQAMDKSGYYRIYDAGTTRWEMNP